MKEENCEVVKMYLDEIIFDDDYDDFCDDFDVSIS